MGKSTERAKLFRQFDEHIEKDYDPEAPDVHQDDGSDESGDDNLGTEHYEQVGKSNLRQKGNNTLGPQYRGARVSRDALEQESEDDDDEDDDEEDEFDDPEEADLIADTAEADEDSEISSDNALGESDDEHLEKFVFRGSSKPKKAIGKGRATAADFMSGSEDDDEDAADFEDEEDDEDEDEDEDMDDGLDDLINGGGTSDEEEEDDEDDDDDDDEEGDEDEEQKSTAKPSMVPLSTRDVEKGKAIQQQRKAYDGLLNLRIRLQKALVSANTFDILEDSDETDAEPYEAAEEAAIKLLNTISGLRDNLAPSTVTGKRKRDFDASTSNEDIWAQLCSEHEASVSFREDRLEKWSRKVQSVNVATTKSLSSRTTPLVTALRDQLNAPGERLVKRTKVPRSCAPAQAAKKVAEDETIFDDADFYQMLLKELVDQRTVDGASSGATAVPSVVLTAARDSKPRKVVDRKASKGRKMRFTVHEKLQNFMAPEDRRSWEQGAIDRFFSTLFGRKLELAEEESDDEAEDAVVVESDFRLFGN
ncbi:Putative Bfr2 [[Torrubiella] hemipterigena]|uniref:Protein BFR2 n=1 Tax=[Torrubiella] hemipterigena TaxID=1531966 RepID=A0A0A1TJR8_9HYPO|nr:Putative Bfr2 [[Torrubiella] hemipterigena]